jgi:hypothetical protein
VHGFAGRCLTTRPLHRWIDAICTFERMTGFEPATPTLARLCATNCATSARNGRDRRPVRSTTIVHLSGTTQIPRRHWRAAPVTRTVLSAGTATRANLRPRSPLGTGLVAQWKSARLTRGRSLVRTQPGPPLTITAAPAPRHSWTALSPRHQKSPRCESPKRRVGANGLRPDHMRVHRDRAGVAWWPG